jgi:hypothetical protein
MYGQKCKRGIKNTTEEKNITGAVHNDFRRNFLPHSLQGLDLHIRIRLWIQHDGAHLHLLLAFRAFLNNVFPEQWIGARWDKGMACSFS